MFVKAFWITACLALSLLGAAGDEIYDVAVTAPGAAIKTGAGLFTMVWFLIFAAGLATSGLSVLCNDAVAWIKDRCSKAAS